MPHHLRDFRHIAQSRQPGQVEQFDGSPQRVWRPAVRIGVHLEIHVGAVIGHEHGLVACIHNAGPGTTPLARCVKLLPA